MNVEQLSVALEAGAEIYVDAGKQAVAEALRALANLLREHEGLAVVAFSKKVAKARRDPPVGRPRVRPRR